MKSASAILALVAILATHGAEASGANRQQAKDNFTQADADANGALTLSEFTTLIDLNAADGIGRAPTIKRFGRYGTVFGRLDANSDGLVTPEEIQNLAAQAQD